MGDVGEHPLPPGARPADTAGPLRLGDVGRARGRSALRNDDAPSGPHAPWRTDPRRASAVGTENRSAADLSSADARVLFAAEVGRSLEGGRAAFLDPRRRECLIAAAVGLGLRTFDANLVIAIVQEAARSGEAGQRETADRLRLIRPSTTSASRSWPATALILSLGLAAVILVALIAAVLV